MANPRDVSVTPDATLVSAGGRHFLDTKIPCTRATVSLDSFYILLHFFYHDPRITSGPRNYDDGPVNYLTLVSFNLPSVRRPVVINI
jgi:hypothetical protein